MDCTYFTLLLVEITVVRARIKISARIKHQLEVSSGRDECLREKGKSIRLCR